MSKAPKIKAYKGVDIFYNIQNGRLSFNFEGEREVSYLFEAEQIIDEPRWEDCDLVGFYLDYSLDYSIGLAKAVRRDIKSGRPDWRYKGKYDLGYKAPQFRQDGATVYPVTPETKAVYEAWKVQVDIAQTEQGKANDIALRLKVADATLKKSA